MSLSAAIDIVREWTVGIIMMANSSRIPRGSLPSSKMGYDPLACLIACLCISVTTWLSMAVRAYVRIRLLSGPWLDDVLAFIATIIFTAVAILFMVNSWYHFSADKYGLSLETQMTGIKLSFSADMLYLLGTFVTKLSFARTLSRIVQTPRQTIVLYATLVVGAIVTVSTIIQGFLYCRPLNFLWEQFSGSGSHGHCQAAWTRMTAALVHAAWVLAADVILGLVLPCILLRGCNMSLRTKISVHVLLGLGSIAGVATIIRMPYIATGLGANLKLNDLAALFWEITELAINIICTAAATWKPLFQKQRRREPVGRELASRKSRMAGVIALDWPHDSEEGPFSSCDPVI
ncbi:hypothetical protein BJX65DRAFT_314454 [Aspergillus insuetus]